MTSSKKNDHLQPSNLKSVAKKQPTQDAMSKPIEKYGNLLTKNIISNTKLKESSRAPKKKVSLKTLKKSNITKKIDNKNILLLQFQSIYLYHMLNP